LRGSAGERAVSTTKIPQEEKTLTRRVPRDDLSRKRAR
jgi:hypothetical protein